MKCATRALTLSASAVLLGLSASALAIPALQLGPGAGAWAYDDSDQTWAISASGSFSVNAFANATKADGGKGKYGFTAANELRYAYIVFSAVPEFRTDPFDIGVRNDGALLSLYASGYGTPPAEDSNDISPHSIYPTWFEIYEFNFNGGLGTISDTQPGGTGTGAGYTETFDVIINGFDGALSGIHIDLFTVSGSGRLQRGVYSRDTVLAVAPYSHDAEVCLACGPPTRVPEPAPLALLGLGLAALGLVSLRSKA